MSARGFGGLLLMLGAALLGGGSAARADVTITTVANPTPISFFAGRLAWSAFDPARNGYVLMTHAAGTTSLVPVGPRGVPFDVDLGPDEHGDTVALYSRCGREPAGPELPTWRTGRGCDIFKFSFATGRETRVASANGARSSEFLPSIWDTRIAFARVYERRKGKAGDRAYLYARSVLGSGSSRQLRPGPRGSVRVCLGKQGKVVCGVPVETGPTALDLRGRRLAFAWDIVVPYECSNTGIWLDTVSGTRRRVETACSTEAVGRGLLSPTLSGGRLDYVRSLFGGELGTGSSLRQYRISSGRRREVLSLRGRVVMWTATDAGRTFYLLSGGFGPGCAPVPGIPGAGAPCVLNELTP
jgi:hypothetical protein